MQIVKRIADEMDFLDGRSAIWDSVPGHILALMPSPLPMASAVSPFMALRTDHGKIEKLDVKLAHNGQTLSVRLEWADVSRDDKIRDLDQFTDGAAIVFPLAVGASALTMGAPDGPVNAWLWKADRAEPFDVFAQGYATSERRPASYSNLKVAGRHDNGSWVVVFQRPLIAAGRGQAVLRPGTQSGIAFAIWEGTNKERSGEKAISGDFQTIEIEA